MPAIVNKKDLLYPELSYKIIGCAYDVYNQLGFGHHEKFYQRAMAESFRFKNIKFSEQVYFPLKFNGKTIGKNFFDFLLEDKIIVELKKDARFSKQHIDQVLEYLRTSNLKLALLINFSKTDVIYKRIINFSNS